MIVWKKLVVEAIEDKIGRFISLDDNLDMKTGILCKNIGWTSTMDYRKKSS